MESIQRKAEGKKEEGGKEIKPLVSVIHISRRFGVLTPHVPPFHLRSLFALLFAPPNPTINSFDMQDFMELMELDKNTTGRFSP